MRTEKRRRVGIGIGEKVDIFLFVVVIGPTLTHTLLLRQVRGINLAVNLAIIVML